MVCECLRVWDMGVLSVPTCECVDYVRLQVLSMRVTRVQYEGLWGMGVSESTMWGVGYVNLLDLSIINFLQNKHIHLHLTQFSTHSKGVMSYPAYIAGFCKIPLAAITPIIYLFSK